MEGGRRRYDSRLRARGVEETRRGILLAARTILFTEPFDEFTLPRVARAAEVTTQTVRNHFGSKDGLLAALAVAVGVDLLERRRSAAPDDGATAAAFLAAEYEEYGRAAVRLRAASERSTALREMGEHGRVEHRRWLETLFGDGLPEDRRQRGQVLDSLYAATDVGTWWLLRVHLGRSRRATAETMGRLIAGALASAGAPPS
ncbi:MAG TPA: helix-turn-helix domain-containing protein [Ornithinibacter sp.]|nr:helix-turn-helix domain-containing protein [Ornithinibacter sp.]